MVESMCEWLLLTCELCVSISGGDGRSIGLGVGFKRWEGNYGGVQNIKFLCFPLIARAGATPPPPPMDTLTGSSGNLGSSVCHVKLSKKSVPLPFCLKTTELNVPGFCSRLAHV